MRRSGGEDDDEVIGHDLLFVKRLADDGRRLKSISLELTKGGQPRGALHMLAGVSMCHVDEEGGRAGRRRTTVRDLLVDCGAMPTR